MLPPLLEPKGPTDDSELTVYNRMCLARGRVYTIPVTPILKRCDRWHMSSIADTMDGHLVSMAVLRRDLVRLRDGALDSKR